MGNSWKSTGKIDEIYRQILEFCLLRKYKLVTKKEDIINDKSEVVYICPIHGECKTRAGSILKGSGCYWCGRTSAAKKRAATTLKERQDSLYLKALSACREKGYELISKKEDILNNETYVTYKCPVHGLQKMRIHNLVSGRNCPKCNNDIQSKKYRLSSIEVEQRVSALGGKLLNKQDYINRYKKNLIIECPICNTPFTISLVLFTQHGGQVCPDCNDSKSVGEKRIRKYLETNNILFEQEKWFPDCRDINPLPFDFYLLDHNIIIEFDGEQHYKQGHFTHSQLSYTQLHDTIKNDYYKNNNIKLIRIPYWDINNIEMILDDKLLISHKDIV